MKKRRLRSPYLQDKKECNNLMPKLTNQAGIIARDLRISIIIATKKLLRSMK